MLRRPPSAEGGMAERILGVAPFAGGLYNALPPYSTWTAVFTYSAARMTAPFPGGRLPLLGSRKTECAHHNWRCLHLETEEPSFLPRTTTRRRRTATRGAELIRGE